MWLFTRYGFFSAVCAREGDGSSGRPVDPGRIMVRARDRGHLAALKAAYLPELGPCPIVRSAGTDYAYRLFVAKEKWARVVAGLVNEVDYDNFKAAVAESRGRDGHEYSSALHDVWAAMRRLQP